MKTYHKLFLSATALFAGTMLLSSCGSSTDNTAASESSTETQEITLTDAVNHEITIPANPQRIIASYLEDYLVALDIIPVAQWTVNDSSIQDYLQDELAEIPTISYDLPYEEVLSFEPDLLLLSDSSQVEGGKYEEYSKIAPTYVVKNGEDVNWRDQLEDIANVLQKESQAESVLAEYDELAETTKETLDNELEDQSVAVLWVINNQVFVVSDTRSSGAVLYGDLGLEIPALVAEISESATADWSQVSLEKLAQLDADYLFLVNSDTSAALFSEDVWNNLPAVKNEHVFEFGSETSWLYNGPIANTKIIEDVKDTLLN